MEELFRSLSESVSEECFEDIMGIVEDLVSKTREMINQASKTAEDLGSELDRKEIHIGPHKLITQYNNAIRQRNKLKDLLPKALKLQKISKEASKGHNYSGTPKMDRNQSNADYNKVVLNSLRNKKSS